MANVELNNKNGLHYNGGHIKMEDALSKEEIAFIDKELKDHGCNHSVSEILDEDGTALTEEDLEILHRLLDTGNGKDDLWGAGDTTGDEVAKILKEWLEGGERAKKVGDGEVAGSVQQGSVGDCWVVGGLNALNASPQGKQKIKENISWDDKGNAKIWYNGTEYEVTKEELEQNSKDGVKGDIDVLAIECAVRKDRIKDGITGEGTDDHGKPINKDPLNGGGPDQFMARFGLREGRLADGEGRAPRHAMADMDKTKLKEFFTKAMADPEGMNISIGAKPGGDGEITNGDGHAYAVTAVNMENETIEYTNPWDSSKKRTITFDQLLELKEVGVMDLNETDEKKTKIEGTRAESIKGGITSLWDPIK